MLPRRCSDNTIEGSVEEIESDVKLPDTRIKSTPENGTQSSEGDLSTEFNIDEQDDFFASVMCCDDWTTEEAESGEESRKSLSLGTSKTEYVMVKKYPQAPVEYRKFTGLQLNQLQLSSDLNDFVKLTWSFMGANYPAIENTDPYADTASDTYLDAKTTKSYLSLAGYLKYGTSLNDLTALRQSSHFELTINNNKERTDALFETEAIEMSDGDFEVTGSLDIWKADDTAKTLMNAGINGEDMCFEVSFERNKTNYIFQLKVHLNSPSEAKDGNKLKVTLPFTMNSADGLKIIKVVKE